MTNWLSIIFLSLTATNNWQGTTQTGLGWWVSSNSCVTVQFTVYVDTNSTSAATLELRNTNGGDWYRFGPKLRPNSQKVVVSVPGKEMSAWVYRVRTLQ